MKKKVYLSILFVLISVMMYFLPLPIASETKIVLGVLIFAVFFWASVYLPLFLTSIIIVLALVLTGILDFKEAVIDFFDPLLVLFFAGFMIARAMQSIDLDKKVCSSLISRMKNAKIALLVLMCITAFFSMWISNTATTALMIPIAIGLVATKKKMDNFSKASVLGIAYAANIGGMGTIIGSPPNGIAVAKLIELTGDKLTFLDWVMHGLPLVVVLIPIAWFLLFKVFPFKPKIKTSKKKKFELDLKEKKFLAIFLLTVGLWFTPSLHGMHSGLVGMIGVVLLFLCKILRPSDLKRINYPALILFGGSLVLGSAVASSGLSNIFATQLGKILVGMTPLLVLLILTLATSIASAVGSNTATAAILVPVMIPLSQDLPFSAMTLSLLVGLAVSLDFILPVGTPPNTIAYSTGRITVKDMMKAGSLLTVVSVVILALFAFLLW